MKILRPEGGHAAYSRAAEIFRGMYAEITGKTPEIVTADDGDDLVIIGGDSVNAVAGALHIDGKCRFRAVPGTDGYHILSYKDGARKLLILAGGRGRSTIYAVYRYFEKFCGCRYFWDGDRIPKAGDVLWDNIDLYEAPRFSYRGIRYFAHRSLHRFQAEHWDLDDWKREIDWLLKKRLNLFMLRLGNEDLFQKAFPDIVDYPADDEPYEGGEARGYNDRTTAWPLRHRGELRKQVLDYAFSQDLLHPEDCGTMTHWYTRTPKAFLETVKPALLSQTTRDYSDRTGLVWDIRDEKNFENYFRLTKTHIREYGRPELFHTIGLAERMYSDDRDANMRMKTYTYHRIAERIAADYPNAPLLIASWDLMLHYTPEEVEKLLGGFDKTRTILLDYTSDSVRRSNFENWGTVGKFPWMFGIFHAYESDNEMRGFYDEIERKLQIAKDDPMCCGFVYWPELSHSDTFMLEYVAANAWAPLAASLPERIKTYCADRYGRNAAGMEKIWQSFFPIMTMAAWNTGERGLDHKDMITDILFYMKFQPHSPFVRQTLRKSEEQAAHAAWILRETAAYIGLDDVFLERDAVDIVRTVIKRYLQYAHWKIEEKYMAGEKTEPLCGIAEALCEILADLLAQYEEYSLCDSYDELGKTHAVNPAFWRTLLKNSSCQYCRTQIYENVKYLYIPEQKLCFELLRESEKKGTHPDEKRAEYVKRAEAQAAAYLDKTIDALRPVRAENRTEFVRGLLETAAAEIEKMIPGC